MKTLMIELNEQEVQELVRAVNFKANRILDQDRSGDLQRVKRLDRLASSLQWQYHTQIAKGEAA